MLQIAYIDNEVKLTHPSIIGMAETGENDANIEKFFNLLDIEHHLAEVRSTYSTDVLRIGFHGDQKILNKLTGLAGSAAKYPCTFCQIEAVREGNSAVKSCEIKLGLVRRSYAGLMRHYFGIDHEENQPLDHWGSTRRPFSIMESDDLQEVCILDGLHLIINNGNLNLKNNTD